MHTNPTHFVRSTGTQVFLMEHVDYTLVQVRAQRGICKFQSLFLAPR